MKAWAFLVWAMPVVAQYADLATDHTGSRVWFSTELRQRGDTERHFLAKIYSVDASGRVELVAQRAADGVHREAMETAVSADGRTVAYHSRYYCSPHPGSRCYGGEGLSVLQGDSPTREFRGRIDLSRNGRFVIRHPYYPDDLPFDYVEWIDLKENARRRIPLAADTPLRGPWLVTSNGSALVLSKDSLWLTYPDGQFQRILSPGLDWPDRSPIVATLDDTGGTIAYETVDDTPAIMLTRPSNFGGPHLTISCPGGCRQPALTADGQRLLFVAENQAWISSTGRDDRRRITNELAGVANAVLSGDGQVVWASTFAGQIIRIGVENREIREVIGQTPVLKHWDPFLGFPVVSASGAIASLDGVGLALQSSTAAAPLPREVAGVTVTSTLGESFPLFSVSPTRIQFQVPWQVRGRRTLTVGLRSASPFESAPLPPLTFDLRESVPAVYYIEPDQPAVAHGDFRGLITPGDPARSGEIIHVYLSGLGPVTPPVNTGEAASAQTLSYATLPIRLGWAGTTPLPVDPPELLFAGLAPGTIGFYQVSLRLPARVPRVYHRSELRLTITTTTQTSIPLLLLP